MLFFKRKILDEEISVENNLEDYIFVAPTAEVRMEGSDMNENSTPVETTAIEADASVVPKVGMEFESEKEAHVFYDRYAKRLGFATKIKSSYINRNTKEMHHVHFACTKEGFKNTKETALYKREDTRVGCKARMRVKLTNSKKWAVSEVILEHNHLVCPSNIKMCTRQLSKFYTRDIFKKFQDEVLGMFRCSNLLQVKVDGQFTYTLKERVFSIDGHKLEPKEYEIIFSLTEVEIRCSCRLFEFKGFLCKHALYVLNHNGIDEIPSRYILSRWRKDFKNLNFLDRIFEKMTNKNPALRDDSLYQLAVQVVGEGITSQQKYEVVLKGLEEIFSKVRDGVNCVGSNSQYGVLPVNKSHPGGSGSQL
ncbi:hypothetical protein GIB67_035458, partial [Kingdonia uniflora]